MKKRKAAWLLLLPILCLALSGCRVRTTGGIRNGESREQAESLQLTGSGSLPEEAADAEETADEQEKNGEPGDRTRENPEASRKEYDENAPAEIVPGTERKIYIEGEGDGASAENEDAAEAAARLNGEAGETATQKVAAEQAEEKGVSEDAEEADSALTYYTVLLQERTGSLFECQRLNVYWETAEDHVTVFKTSPEHTLILTAGAYDVSARLLAENLRVDDGWIGRKNPDVVVKTVAGSVLGSAVSSAAAARKVYESLLARDGWTAINAVRGGRVLLLSEELLEAPHLQTAAMLMIAKTAYPELFEDTDIGKTLEMLAEEATGVIPSGTYYYTRQGW